MITLFYKKGDITQIEYYWLNEDSQQKNYDKTRNQPIAEAGFQHGKSIRFT